MSQLTLNDVDDSVWTKLREQAAAHGLSPEAEAKAILSQALVRYEPDPWAAVDAIRERLATAGREFSDSAELMAEDRLR
jgi:plasmid stability protein